MEHQILLHHLFAFHQQALRGVTHEVIIVMASWFVFRLTFETTRHVLVKFLKHFESKGE